MLVLFETPAGFALFKVLDEGKLSKVEVMRFLGLICSPFCCYFSVDLVIVSCVLSLDFSCCLWFPISKWMKLKTRFLNFDWIERFPVGFVICAGFVEGVFYIWKCQTGPLIIFTILIVVFGITMERFGNFYKRGRNMHTIWKKMLRFSLCHESWHLYRCFHDWEDAQ